MFDQSKEIAKVCIEAYRLILRWQNVIRENASHGNNLPTCLGSLGSKAAKVPIFDPRQEKFVVLYYKTLQICNAWIIW